MRRRHSRGWTGGWDAKLTVEVADEAGEESAEVLAARNRIASRQQQQQQQQQQEEEEEEAGRQAGGSLPPPPSPFSSTDMTSSARQPGAL